MALSDQLTELTARAKDAEEHAAAAQGKAKADVGPLRHPKHLPSRSAPDRSKSETRAVQAAFRHFRGRARTGF